VTVATTYRVAVKVSGPSSPIAALTTTKLADQMRTVSRTPASASRRSRAAAATRADGAPETRAGGDAKTPAGSAGVGRWFEGSADSGPA
jgi:hypothetical protein